ncbi:phage holin family protein [Pseudomonas matsuisoli]|uniref:Membrane protein n=1 Tax=Pseudomonas matsuisoli TaxID=1515666 RepID=A0A917PSX8_9PSED|nr:phage holin family protein [Pseudomonas matsuisoli]GGJ89828.1 membrane protein [Pseudomonas matsuisoli]
MDDEITAQRPVPPSQEAPRPSLKRLGGAAVGLFQSHLELLGIELQEEKSRTFQLFIFSGLSLIFGLLVIIGASAAILVACWDEYRLSAVLGLCLLYGLGLLACVFRAIQLVRRGEAPFHATLEELARNRERLLP